MECKNVRHLDIAGLGDTRIMSSRDNKTAPNIKDASHFGATKKVFLTAADQVKHSVRIGLANSINRNKSVKLLTRCVESERGKATGINFAKVIEF